jgi:hypothetical protein
VDQIVSRNPEDEFARPDEKAIASAITISTQLSQSRSIVIQTYIPRDSGISVYHATVDKLTATMDRQQAKADLADLQINLETEETQLKNLLEDYSRIEPRAESAWNSSNKKGPFKLSQQEIVQKGQAETNIKRFRDATARRKVDIAKCEAIIAKRD